MLPSQQPQPQPVQILHGAYPEPPGVPEVVTPKKPGKLLRLPAVEDRTGF